MQPFIYIILTLLPLVVFGYLYNQLVQKKNQIQNAISATDALFIKRSDLIPNLITSVKQYMKFEGDTLEKITALRDMKSNTNPEVEQQAQQALKGLMVQVENYPDLKASNSFRDLQYSMNEVEEQISAGRRYISSSITDYNNKVMTLPTNIIAGLAGFKKYEWQYAQATQRNNIDTKSLFND